MFEKRNKQSGSIIKFDTQITISAHDAGAAHHLLEIYKKNISNSKLCLDGPAIDIFNNYFPNFKNYDLKDSLLGSKYLISGTSWGSSLEHDSRKLASEKSIFNISIIDHWVNYHDRFKKNEEVILPNQIWVTDDEALKIAKNFFSNIPIIQIPNFWLEDIKLKVHFGKKKLLQNKINNSPFNILYFTEPIRSKWGDIEKEEFQSMRYFFENLEKFFAINYLCPINKLREITIKLHPSEKPTKYNNLIKEFKGNIPIKITMEKDISKLLINSDACIGCETQALILSLICGLPTFSIIPPWGPKCSLPHKGIIYLRNIF